MTQEDSHQEKTIENHIENDKVEIELAYNEGNLGKALPRGSVGITGKVSHSTSRGPS